MAVCGTEYPSSSYESDVHGLMISSPHYYYFFPLCVKSKMGTELLS